MIRVLRAGDHASVATAPVASGENPAPSTASTISFDIAGRPLRRGKRKSAPHHQAGEHQQVGLLAPGRAPGDRRGGLGANMVASHPGAARRSCYDHPCGREAARQRANTRSTSVRQRWRAGPDRAWITSGNGRCCALWPACPAGRRGSRRWQAGVRAGRKETLRSPTGDRGPPPSASRGAGPSGCAPRFQQASDAGGARAADHRHLQAGRR